MIPLYTPAQVRGMDERAFARGVASLALMERAAGHLARAVLAAGGRGYGLRVGVLAGTGNNGGDGLAAARRLVDAGAWPQVCIVGDADRLSSDAAAQLDRWRALGGRVTDRPEEALAGADVVVDCLLGTGARGAPRQPYASAVDDLNAARARGAAVVACDTPTGVDADTGAVPGGAVDADVTVTLGADKRGLQVWPGRGHAGRIVVGDLGICQADDEPAAHVLEPADVAALVPPPDPRAHKRSRGVVTVLAGGPGMSGAPTLVARGAMAAGAGLVTVATPASVRDLVAPTVPEAVTLALPDDDPDAALTRLVEQLSAADVLALGPGLGVAEPTRTLVRRLVAEAGVPIVCDADGLNAFRHEGAALADHAAPLVLTPHERELTRLLGPEAPSDFWQRRVTTAPETAAAWDVTLVAKGPGSLTAAPDGRVWVNPTGGPALATAGTGDVLTGMTAALMARRAAPESVAAAVYLQGLAGDLAAADKAVRSVTALDVAAAVPAALRAVEGGADNGMCRR